MAAVVDEDPLVLPSVAESHVFLPFVTPSAPNLCLHTALKTPPLPGKTHGLDVWGEECASQGSAGGPAPRQRFFQAPSPSFLPLQSSSYFPSPPVRVATAVICALDFSFFSHFFFPSPAPAVAFPFKVGEKKKEQRVRGWGR